jgi:hypothetical protein
LLYHTQALQGQGHPTSKPDGRTQRSYAYQQQLQHAPPNGTPLLPPGPSALYGLKQGAIRNVAGEGSSRIPFNGASDAMDPGTFSRGFGLRGTHSSSVSEENFNGYFGGSNHREQSGPPANQPYDGNAFSDLRGQGLMSRAPHSAVQGNDSNSSAKLNYTPPGFLFNRKNDSQVLSQGPHGTMGGPGVNRQVGPGGFNTPPGMSQQRSAHQASQLQTSSQLNYLNQSLNQNQNQSLLSEVPMRSQNSVFSSAGFDDPSLGRNTHIQPAGQSQQVFHSQQQLQEQESSRLHHQSQQYSFQEYGNHEGAKAKSFNAQYAASKGSNFFGAAPAHTQHSQYSNKIQGYSSGSVKNMNMAVSKGAQPQGPLPQSWEQSSPFRGQGGDGRGQSMLNGSLSGTGVGLDPQLGQHFQDSRAQGQGQGHSGGQSRAGFPFDSHQSNGAGNGFDASLLSSLMSNSPSLSGSRTPQRLSSQPSDAGGSHHHSNSYSHSHSLGSNSSYPSSSIGRSLSGTMASINLTDLDDSADRKNFHSDNVSLNKNLVGLGRDSRDDGNYFSSERFTQSADSDDRVHSFFNHRDHPRVPGNEINARLRQGQELDPFQARTLLPTQGVRSLSGPISNPGSIQDSFRSSDLSRF